MPRVPYSPVPDVAPANTPAPYFSVSTPPAAFGASIAQAVEGLGSTMDKVGGELYSRAVAMQQLRNETEKSNAINEVEKRNSLEWEQFKSQQGMNAASPEAFKAYQDRLAKNRDDVRAGLSNPMVQKLFDPTADSLTNRLVNYGAGHAAQQNKIAVDGAAAARVSTLHDSILQNPKDDTAYNQSIDEIKQQVQLQGSVRGWAQDQTDREMAKAISGARRSQIDGINRTDPIKAKQMLEQYRGELDAGDIEHLEQRNQNSYRQVVSRNVSDAVNKGWGAWMTPQAISRAEGVQEPLVRIIQQAQRDHPELHFTIPDKGGTRTSEEQAKLVAQGFSKTLNSNHLSGRAIDLAPIGQDGKPNFEDRAGYAKIESAMKDASDKLGIPLGGEHDKIRSWDPGHYSLPREYDVGSAPKRVDEPEQSRVDRGTKYSQLLFQDDPFGSDVTRDRIQTDFSKTRMVERNTLADNWETVIAGIMDTGTGKPANNQDELMANAKTAGAFDALPPDRQRRIPGMIKSYLRSLDARTDLGTLTQLRGMAASDPEEFLGKDIIGDENLQLSQKDRRDMALLQVKLRNAPERDPDVGRALNLIGPNLNSAGITKALDPNRWWQFNGDLQDAIHDQMKSHGGRKLSADELLKIGKALIYGTVTTTVPNPLYGKPIGFGGTYFEQSPTNTTTRNIFDLANRATPKELDEMTVQLQKENPNMQITPDVVQRAIRRKLFDKFFATQGKEK